MVLTLPTDAPLATAAVAAVHAGDVATLRRLLAEHSGLAAARLGGDVDQIGDGGMTRTLLHVATDWPGHYPHVDSTITTLVAFGAEINARFTGPHAETPLHWAASSDDVTALDALLDSGADIEARGAVIGGGTALADATAFGSWNAARRLVDRGARCTLFEAAALGMSEQVTAYLRSSPPPRPTELTEALWGACHGGQQGTVELLLAHGADVEWVGWDGLTPRQAAERSGAVDLVAWLDHHGGPEVSV